MGGRPAYLWRLACTALTRVVFGASALALGFVILPALRRWGPRDEPDDLRAQRILHRCARAYLGFAVRLGIMRLDMAGTERLVRGGPHLVVANHPTLVDFVILCSVMPQADCILKADLAEQFLLKRLARAAAYVRNDAGKTVVRECAERLARGRSLVVFPEGTRSPPGGLAPFRRGAARIALAAGCELLPVLISCEPLALTKERKWYELPERPFHVTLRVGTPLGSKPARGVSGTVAARRLTAELRETFSKGLDIADARIA